MEKSFVPLAYRAPSEEALLERARGFYRQIRTRRSVRQFSDRPVPREVIELAIQSAARAPSGANQQPWHFVAVSDPATKRAIRLRAEAVEREFYARRAPKAWKGALKPLGTGPSKPFLEEAPWLIAVFAQTYGFDAGGRRVKHYFVTESVGLATGFLVAALHFAGLATLTYTPSPMGFLRDLLGRPENERPFMLVVTGYPSPEARVPVIGKKPLEAVATFVEPGD